jgi:hypothetical protein
VLVPEPGYRLHWKKAHRISGADPRKRESVLLRLTWRGARGAWEARLVPFWLNEQGEPEPPTGALGEQIVSRIQIMSGELGCQIDSVAGEARLAWRPDV